MERAKLEELFGADSTKQHPAKAFRLLKAFVLFSITQPKSEFSILFRNILFTSDIIEAFSSECHLPTFTYSYKKNCNNKSQNLVVFFITDTISHSEMALFSRIKASSEYLSATTLVRMSSESFKIT